MFCLIRPPGVETFRIGTLTIAPPLGAAYIAAAVEASGRPVSVIDAVAEAPRTHTAYFRGYLIGLRLEEIVRRIPAEAAVVGITCIFTHEWPLTARLIALIKRARPELRVVVGGEHVSCMPEFSMATAPADYLVIGEGEETIIDLLGLIERGGNPRYVPGIAFRDGDDIVVNPRRARNLQIDELPPPAWHHFDLKTYHENRFVGGMYSASLTVPMLATRGCPYQCTYCSSPNMWTPRWVARKPTAVVDEMEDYVRRLGAGNFPFQDLTAILDRDWIVEFCEEILRRGLDITWQLPSGTRSEAIDAEVAHLLARTGMACMAYAPESGSETTRRLIKKRMRTDKLFASIRAAAQADLNVAAFVVLGFPHDRPEHMRETLEFVKEIAAAGVTDLGTSYYMALPGTELFNNIYRNGGIELDRRYFRHILEGLAIIPANSYCDEIGRVGLLFWRARLSLAFYLASLRKLGAGAAWRGVRRAFGDRSHGSKLQTAVRVAIKNGISVVKSRLGRRWMPRHEEDLMFAEWDAVYREIWDHRLRNGLPEPPADPAELSRTNVIRALRSDHEATHTFRPATVADGSVR